MFADPLEVSPPQLGNSNVVNVMSFSGVNNNGVTETSALQAALNYVAAHTSTTPILYFPAGVYRTATLQIGSSVQVYLSSGAVILADPTEADYPSLPGSTGGIPTSALIAIRGASNAKIFGRGVVDGGGYNLYATYGKAMGIFDLFTDGGTNNLTVNDVMFTNSVMWQTAIQGAHDLTFSNVKFNNPQGNVGNEDDAFKVNGVYNLTFTNGWLSARDDTMTFAAVGPEAIYNTSNINMSGTVLDSSGTASAEIRFADIGSGQTMTGMNVSNIYDISYGRGMTFRGDGGNSPYQNGWGSGTVLNNWDIESPAPLVWFGVSGTVNVTISGITISNMTTPAAGGGHILGDSTNVWNNIQFSNIMTGGVVASDLKSLGLTINSFATGVNVAADSSNTDLAIPTTARPETTTTTSIASGYSASSATDGNFSTFFKSATAPTFPQYLTVTWPVAHSFSGATVVCDHCQGQAPTNWNVQVSANGTSGWTTMGTSGTVSWLYNDNSYESYLVSFPALTAKGVRIQINSANNQWNQYQVDELEVIPANGAPAATATTTSLRSGDSASAANSGVWDTFFKSASAPTFPQYYTLQWPAPQTVGAVSLVCDYCGGQAPTNWNVQISTNGVSNWTTVASSGTVTWPGPNDGTRQIDVVSFAPVTVEGVRLKINNANLAFGQYQIDQVETMPLAPVTTEFQQNFASNLCLDDPNGSTTPGTFVDIAACSGAAQQGFAYNPVTETLTTEGLCLDSYGGGATPGTQIDLYTCLGAGNPSQQWTLNANNTIVSVESGLCVQENGTASGSQLALQTCNASNQAQDWAGLTVQPFVDGASSLCMTDPGGSTTPGTFADVEACGGGAKQEFTYNPVTGTVITAGLCMDSYGGGSSPGTKVDLYTCLGPGHPSQVWTLTGNEIVSGESGLCVQENGTASGSQLALQYCDVSNTAESWSGLIVQTFTNGASSLCLDDPGGVTPSTFADVASCNGGGPSQQFAYNAGTGFLSSEGLCADSYHGGSSPGTPVDLYICLGTGYPSQVWTLNTNGTIVSGESGLCVQENGTASGSQLALQSCNASNPAQVWTPSL
ncbi:MAG TPA: ricin-type beta-trefoil lectin domain protein [Gaiellaceae bacterium]|nr:ricin-type beta-trefoil lectin domain protein [Gaiellaceae bacterium]